MDTTTTDFRVLTQTLNLIGRLRPLVGRLRRKRSALADQLERALTSIALNLSEGNAVRDGNRRKHFRIALGSAKESRTALRVGAAWGYLSSDEIAVYDRELDSICAQVHRLQE